MSDWGEAELGAWILEEARKALAWHNAKVRPSSPPWLGAAAAIKIIKEAERYGWEER